MLKLLVLLVIQIPEYKDTIYFKGDSIFYHPAEEKVVLKGNAYIKYKNIELISDSCIFLRKENLLLAYGNPYLISGKDTLRGDFMKFNIKTQKGYAYEGKSKVEKGFVWGEKIYRTDKKVIKGFTGFFTTCELEEPHYYFRSNRMKVLIGDVAVASPVIMEIKEIPVLWAPFWVFPISPKRKSGFLIPRPGRNSTLGLYLKNLSYYWAINNYMDLTLTMDIYERKGPLLGFNFVYLIYKKLTGNFKATYTREIDTGTKRWSLVGDHKQNLPFGFSLNAHSDFISDEKYILEYSDIRVGRVKSESESHASISKRFTIGSFVAHTRYKKDFINKIEVLTAPSVNFILFQKNLSIFRTSFNFLYSREIYKDTLKKDEKSGFSISNSTGIQKILFDILSFSAGVNTKAGVLNKDTLGNDYPFLKNLSTNASLTTKLYGLSLFGIPPFQRFLHTITLSSGYSYSPYIKNPPVKSFAGLGPQQRSSRISFTIRNDYEGKIVKDEQKKKVNFLSFTLNRAYDLIDKKWSDISLTGNFLQNSPVNGSFSLTYFTQDKKWKNLTFQLAGALSLKSLSSLLFEKAEEQKDSLEQDTLKQEKELRTSSWNTSLTYTYRNIGGVSGFLNFRLSGGITPKWKFSFHTTFDTQKKIFIERGLSLTRDLHCFSARVTWSKTGSAWDYQFKIWITKLPDLKFERGLFETILPAIQE